MVIVSAVGCLVENRPGRQHSHHGGFSGSRGHFSAIPQQRLDAVGLLLGARFIQWDLDTLQEVGSGLIQKDDGFGSFQLGEEKFKPPAPFSKGGEAPGSSYSPFSKGGVGGI